MIVLMYHEMIASVMLVPFIEITETIDTQVRLVQLNRSSMISQNA